jgi:hypothetical protein
MDFYKITLTYIGVGIHHEQHIYVCSRTETVILNEIIAEICERYHVTPDQIKVTKGQL